MTGPTGVDGIVGNGTGEGEAVIVGSTVGVGGSEEGVRVGGSTVGVTCAGVETHPTNRLNTSVKRA